MLSVLRAANKTGRFWVGASDFEERGKFKWYYSGKQVSESNWLENGGRPKPVPSKDDDESCLQVGGISGQLLGPFSVHSSFPPFSLVPAWVGGDCSIGEDLLPVRFPSS